MTGLNYYFVGNGEKQEARRRNGAGIGERFISNFFNNDNICHIFNNLTYETFDWESQFCLKCLWNDFKSLAAEQMDCNTKRGF